MRPQVFCEARSIEATTGPRFGARYGEPWTAEEIAQLIELCRDDSVTLLSLCRALKRPPNGVLSAMAKCRMLRYNNLSSIYEWRPLEYWINLFTRKRVMTNDYNDEKPVKAAKPSKAKTIETVTMIQGEDASRLSDDDVFALIGRLEVEIASYEKIQHRPKKLDARIGQLKADISKLVEFVDAR